MNTLTRMHTHNSLVIFVVFPLVKTKIAKLDQSLNAEFNTLNKNTETRQTRNNTVKLLAYPIAEHL